MDGNGVNREVGPMGHSFTPVVHKQVSVSLEYLRMTIDCLEKESCPRASYILHHAIRCRVFQLSTELSSQGEELTEKLMCGFAGSNGEYTAITR
jgi:hypothetical protein